MPHSTTGEESGGGLLHSDTPPGGVAALLVDDDRSSMNSLLVETNQMIPRSASSTHLSSDTAPTPPPPPEAAAAAAAPPDSATTLVGSSGQKKRRAYRKEYPAGFWYEMCERFMTNQDDYSKSHLEFLKSPDSGVLDCNDRQSFGRRLKLFKEGKLPRDDSIKRTRKGKYQDVEQCLLAFLETREQFMDKGKMAVSWPFLTEMAKRFAVALGHSPGEFSGSPGWLANTLKRAKKKIDFEISEDDALFYLESIKRYCRKAKLGVQAQTLSAQLQNIIRGKIVDGNKEDIIVDDDDEGIPVVEDDVVVGGVVDHQQRYHHTAFAPPPHNPPRVAGLSHRAFDSTNLTARGSLSVASLHHLHPQHLHHHNQQQQQQQSDRYHPLQQQQPNNNNVTNFPFWATQQQNI